MNTKNIIWAIAYVLSFFSIPLSLFTTYNNIVGAETFGSLVRFFLILFIPFVSMPKYIRFIIAVLSLSSIFGTIAGFGYLLSRFDIKTIYEKMNITDFAKKLGLMLLGTWALDAIIILPVMKYHNSVLFSTLDIVRVLTALVVLFFVFKMKPNFNIKLFGVYAILVFVFYQYGVFFGHFLLSWPL